MRIVVLGLLWSGLLFSARVAEGTWPAQRSFQMYLQENNVSDLLETLTEREIADCNAIQAGAHYFELRDHGVLRQALIPLSSTRQIHLACHPKEACRIEVAPIACRQVQAEVRLDIQDGYDKQIERLTHYPRLSYAVSRLFKGTLALGKLLPTDRLAFTYTQASRLGRPWGEPKITSAYLLAGGKPYFVYVDKRGHVHHDISRTITYKTTEKRPFTYTKTRKVPGPKFRMPLDHVRITSRFSLRRWHPILHKYRPHHGVDFGAKMGTPLRAVHDGKVVYAGWMRGYGRVVKIDHGNGLVSLYAHQSKILVKLRQHVTRGQTIGRVGSSGRSTGPHLHFGLYRHGKPIDPLLYLSRKGNGKKRTVKEKHTVMKSYPITRNKKVAIRGAKKARDHLKKLINTTATQTHQWLGDEKNLVPIHEITVDKKLPKRTHG